MRKIAALMVIAASSMAPTAAACLPGRAVVRLTDRDPLTVRGVEFEARERVRVTLSAPVSARRVTRANANGSFEVIFLSVSADRCDVVRALATGDEGNRVILKILPSPACAPALSP